jgi:hypothetical protein
MPEWRQDLENLLDPLGFAYASSLLSYDEVSYSYKNAARNTEIMFIFRPDSYQLTYRCLNRWLIASVTCPAPRRRRNDRKNFRACAHLIVKAGVGSRPPQHVLDLHALLCACRSS